MCLTVFVEFVEPQYLLQDEGLCLGGSSGINIAGAVRMAREMGPRGTGLADSREEEEEEGSEGEDGGDCGAGDGGQAHG